MEYVSLLAPISFVFALAALTQVGSLTEKRSREVKKKNCLPESNTDIDIMVE